MIFQDGGQISNLVIVKARLALKGKSKISILYWKEWNIFDNVSKLVMNFINV